MADPGVSVIIPTRDRCDLVRRAVESVYAQTSSPLEVLVIDDGSTDDTAEMIERAFPETTLLSSGGTGVSAARNCGISASNGEWIALLDSDDEWLPTKLERQWATLAGHPGTYVCHTDEIWVRRGIRVNPKKKHAKHGGHIFERCLPLCCMSPSSILLHRRVLDEVGTFDEALPVCEDYDLWLRITARYPVAFVDEALVVKYGGHDDQLSRRYWGMDRFRIQAIEKILASGSLSPDQEESARRVLAEKVKVYAAGARKRGKLSEARTYTDKLETGRDTAGLA